MLGVERGAEQVPGPRAQSLDALLARDMVRADDHDRRAGDEGVVSQLATHFQAVPVGKNRVEDDDVGLGGAGPLPGLGGRVRLEDPVAAGHENGLERPARGLLVTRDQYRRAATAGPAVAA